jgi:hypothetical protein
VVVAVALATLLAGCGGVSPPGQVSVEAGAGYAVEDVEVWTSGGTTEYRTKVVLTATLRRTADSPARVPPVAVAFALASSDTATVPASYEVERRLTAYGDLGNLTLSGGDTLPVRAVFDPEGSVTVRNATVRVRPNATTSSG